ncbi:MAG: hypothetical protein ACRCU6_06060 [Fusobacteriaceae bacterium]
MVKLDETYYTSDLHFGSDIIAETRGFKNSKEWEDYYITTHNSLIQKNQRVILVGDIAKKEENLEILNYLNGSIHIVLGNHDKPIWFKEKYRTHPMLIGDGLVVTHFPVHPCFFSGNKEKWINIHGHTHYYTIPDDKYFNVCPDVRSNKPVLYKRGFSPTSP